MAKKKANAKSSGESSAPGGAGQNITEAFAFFSEVGIISQLSGAILARSLPDGVHPSHFAIVNHLCRMGDGRSPLRIAAAMQVTKTTMTHSLKVLAQNGFISIKPNPEDARGKHVFLTSKGRRFREKAIRQTIDSYSSVLDDEQLSLMKKLLPDLTALRRFLDSNRLQ